MIELIALFFAQFFSVFLLGLNSQIVRDQLIGAAIFLSFNISIAQFTYTRVVAGTDDVMMAFMFSAFGGAVGIATSIKCYQWIQKRRLRVQVEDCKSIMLDVRGMLFYN